MESRDQLSIEMLERIDAVCCRFEEALKRNECVDLRTFVAGTEGAEETALLLELISLDIDYRRRRGSPSATPDYASIFPDHRATIEQALARDRNLVIGDTQTVANAVTRMAEAKPNDRNAIPTQIGRYRVLQKIATGGAGVVYRGFDDELQRDVAIKVPYRDLVSSGQPAVRFLTEARLVAGLNHSAIVPVYDVGRISSGECYVVSKFMEGGDLGTRIRLESPSLAESAMIVRRIAEAMHYAHALKLVHRDIKPSNLLSDAEGQVYIADFGAAIQDNSRPTVGFVGTPAYMSPEQARCESHLVDARTDVYSLGVVLYELITGSRPFRSQSVTKLLAEVIASDPVPPRQLNAAIPAELERIALKAMAKKASERYPTARQLANDLREWTEDEERTKVPHGTDGTMIVPKGLRSFEASDAEFFLRLLPGPRDRHGVPENIRFWQARIDEILPGEAFRVGVIFGSSGCGKSSLVKAGLLPLLGNGVQTILIEARPESTEAELLHALEQISEEKGDLAEVLRSLRHKRSSHVRKVLIVIDQFEQWLHAHHDFATAPLTNALRQCDGVRTQCLLLVRDDFWMPLVRFMAELEVRLAEHQNTMAVDLFDLLHARNVLIGFGQAYGRLPPLNELSRDNKRFVEQALSSLQQDGTISPVRLSLFAEMMKSEVWTPAALRQVGGTEGLGIKFLNRFFMDTQSHPAHRAHCVAARNVLANLLPIMGVAIRGHIRSEAELLKASGYHDRPDRFKDLIQLLDQQLRLITPTEGVFEMSDSGPLFSAHSEPSTFYQLTHDFMVNPIREWVTQGQRQTIRGRAELCLAERTALWNRKPERRQLPGLFEWMHIRTCTDRQRWTDSQRKMLRHAARSNLQAIVIFVACLGLLGLASWHAVGTIRAKSALSMLRHANTEDLLEVLHDIEPLDRWLTPLLRNELATAAIDQRDHNNLSLALLRDDPTQSTFLCEALLHLDHPRELRVIRDGMIQYADTTSKRNVTESLWNTLANPNVSSEQRFRAACVLAGLAPKSSRWNSHAEEVVEWLVSKPIDQLSDWLETLLPVRQYLVASLERAFLAAEADGSHQIAAFALANFLEDADQVERIVDLVKHARPSQIPALVETLRAHGDSAIAFLKNEGQIEFAAHDVTLPPSQKSPPQSVLQPLEDAQGALTTRFAFCQMLPIDDLSHVIESLRTYGYRPIRLRPFRHKQQQFIAGIWTRDDYDWESDVGISADEFASRDAQFRDRNLAIEELSGYQHDGKWKYIAVWSADTEIAVDYRVSLAMKRDRWQSEFDGNAAEYFAPFTIQYAIGANSDLRLTQIFRRPKLRNGFEQRFNASPDRLSELGKLGTNYITLDTSMNLSWPSVPFGVVWRVDPYVNSATLIVESPDELMHRWTEMYRDGFRPVAISLDSDESRLEPKSATVWHRPIPTDEAKQRFVDMKSNVVVALLTLGETEAVLPFFHHSSDPTLRSYLIHKTSQARVPVNVIHRCLTNDSLPPDIRQALILALGDFTRTSVHPEKRQAIVETLRHIFQHDQDAGVHSAVQWLLSRWNISTPSVSVADRKPPSSLAHREWFRNPRGRTMVVLDFPDDFQPQAAIKPPSGHRFAIATTEITVSDFAEFQPEHKFNEVVAAQDTCPANNMNWFAAVEYCNWLSQQEGIPQSGWCYLPNEQGEYVEGMRIAEDFLSRPGYRLPLAAEWLYAASAGAATPFFFGTDAALLSKYGWLSMNSQESLHPVGTLRPNLFGLFDIYGNVKEWSHSLEGDYADGSHVDAKLYRSVLGVSFVHFAIHVRENYGKHGNRPKLRENRNGFRVARTVHPDAPE